MIPKKGFRIARFRGISIDLHWSWFIIFLILFWVVLQFYQLNTVGSLAVLVPMSLVTTFLFFVSVLLHELSHAIVANRNGIPIKRITLFVFGGVAQMSKDVTSPGVEFKMAIAGPLCSYALSILFGGAAYLTYTLGGTTLYFGFAILGVVNFGLGTFNLMPGFPLDGGRILRSLLWRHWGDLERSTRTASRLGEGMGGIFIVTGVSLLVLDFFYTAYDFLFASVWFILIGTFLIQVAFNSYRQVRMRVSLAGSTVADLMRPGVPAVDSSTTLEEVYRLHLEMAPTSTIPVLKQGRLAAYLNLSDLRSVEASLWPETPSSQVARPVLPSDTAFPSMPLFDAMLIMERSGREFLWVVDEGRLTGVLLRDDARLAAKQKQHN